METGDDTPPPALAPFDEAQAKAHQQAWADYLCLPVEKEISLPGGEKMAFMLIPPGEFLMGTNEADKARLKQAATAAKEEDWVGEIVEWEGPQHRARITQPFYLAKYETTQVQWAAVMNNNPSRFKGDPTHPVESVSWYEARQFLAELNKSAASGESTFVLPTEAQWEFACRAGTTTDWSCGNDEAELRKCDRYNVTTPNGKETDQDGTGRDAATERLRLVRHARPCVGVVLRLACGRSLRLSVCR